MKKETYSFQVFSLCLFLSFGIILSSATIFSRCNKTEHLYGAWKQVVPESGNEKIFFGFDGIACKYTDLEKPADSIDCRFSFLKDGEKVYITDDSMTRVWAVEFISPDFMRVSVGDSQTIYFERDWQQ